MAMTQTADTRHLEVASWRTDSATRYLNRVGNFWHAVHNRQPGDRMPSNPSKASKHHTYDHAYAVNSLLGLDLPRCSTLLDIIAVVDATHAQGVGKVKLTAKGRREIIATVTR